MKGWKDSKKGIGEEVGFYMGRFNPIHRGHETIIWRMLSDRLDTIIIAIGGATGARTFKNPWTFAERSIMINLAFESVKEQMKKQNSPSFEMPKTKLRIVGIPDYISDYRWEQDVRVRVQGITHEDDDVTIYGYEKDKSSYYLKMFPEWGFINVEASLALDATTVREEIYRKNVIHDEAAAYTGEHNFVSKNVANFISGWVESDEFNVLRKEWEFINDYKRQFEGLKHKPVFVTVDALFITRRKEVILLKRKEYPGLNTLAMPGGFIDPDLTLRQSINKIVMQKLKLDIEDLQHTRMEVIDKPDRSLRGRTLTNVFVFENFKREVLPDNADFYQIGNLGMHRQQMFEDHFMIIDHLLY